MFLRIGTVDLQQPDCVENDLHRQLGLLHHEVQQHPCHLASSFDATHKRQIAQGIQFQTPSTFLSDPSNIVVPAMIDFIVS
jgi:hypothetical protein